jgi:hypothetical protein
MCTDISNKPAAFILILCVSTHRGVSFRKAVVFNTTLIRRSLFYTKAKPVVITLVTRMHEQIDMAARQLSGLQLPVILNTIGPGSSSAQQQEWQ